MTEIKRMFSSGFAAVPPASRGQLTGMTVIAVLGVIIGVVAFGIDFLTGHVSRRTSLAVEICEILALSTGLIALFAYWARRRFITRAVGLVMELQDVGAPSGAEFDDAIRYRNALVLSGDFEIAYHIQDAVTRR